MNPPLEPAELAVRGVVPMGRPDLGELAWFARVARIVSWAPPQPSAALDAIFARSPLVPPPD